MTITRTQAILFAVALVIASITFFIAGRGCGPSGDPIIVVEQRGIDAGPGEREIEARLDASLQVVQAHIEQIEEKFEEDMAAFDARQRAEYERLRGGDDLEAAAQYLSDWNRRRRDGGR